MRRRNRKLTHIYRLAGVLGVLGLLSIIFSLFVALNSKIIGNVRINNMSVSGLTRSETERKFSSAVDNIYEDEIVLKHKDDAKTFTLKSMEMETDAISKIQEACAIGRKDNIFANNFKILNTWINGEDIELGVSFNSEILQSIFSNLSEEWDETFVDNSYYIDGEKLIVVRGQSGIVVDEDGLKQALVQLVRDKISGKNVSEIEIPLINKTPGTIDFEKIKNEIYKEPQNASFDSEKTKLTVESNGIDFAISIDEANEIAKAEQPELSIPLKITRPAVTTDMLGEDAFPDVLASFSTRFDARSTNRATNIELAAKALNGTILRPGERFSFNSIVGPTTASKGYLQAGAYAAGELVQNYGGGICQVSSTVYNVVLYANLEIVERYNHSSLVSYVDPGRDATISYGAKDFKFKNSRQYAIKLNARATNGILEVEIRGIKEDVEYEVEIISEKTETIPCNVKYVYDRSLEPGQEVVQSYGSNGAKSVTYKVVKQNGRVVSKDVLSRDSYNPMVKVIKTGSPGRN